MRAIFYRLRFLVAVFSKRVPVPRSTYLTTETGAIITDENGEAITIS